MDKWSRYSYKGPILDKFDKVIETEWYGETAAPTLHKAISNLKYQFKTERGLPSYSFVKIDTFYLSGITAKTYRKEEYCKEKQNLDDESKQLTLF